MMGRKRFGIENEVNELLDHLQNRSNARNVRANPFSVPRCIGRETGTRTGRRKKMEEEEEEGGGKGREGMGWDGIFDFSSDG